MNETFQSRYQILPALDPAYGDIAAVTLYWESLLGGAFAPSWRAVDLTALPPRLVPRICVLDVHHDPLDFHYRFWGTAITNIHKLDGTGRSVREIPPLSYASLLHDQYRLTYEAQTPKTFVCEFETDRGLVCRYVVRRLPLSNDGRTVTGVLSIEEHGDDKDDLTDLFETVAPERDGG